MQLRKERGWSQEECASACQLQGWNISRNVIARIEGGIRPVPDFEVMMLSAIFKVPASALYPQEFRRVTKPAQ